MVKGVRSVKLLFFQLHLVDIFYDFDGTLNVMMVIIVSDIVCLKIDNIGKYLKMCNLIHDTNDNKTVAIRVTRCVL